jgi:PAS domain-containing protein
MDQPRQQSSRADILTFPHMTRKDEQLLQTVLNNMSQGVLMFDSETRLTFCNKRYIELYGLSSEIVRPGCHLRDLLRHRSSLGASRMTLINTLPGSGTALLRERLSVRS